MKIYGFTSIADSPEKSISKTGVVYITENLIRKMAKEEDFYRIFKLDLTVAKDLNKKIKVKSLKGSCFCTQNELKCQVFM